MSTVEGTFWGGNLSVLASLAGTPYMPDIQGGILFIEDVSEQPYRIERMLNTLYLSGVLQKQRAIIFGDFRMGTIRDVYDSSYDFSAVVNHISRTAKIPVLTGFPFGHITNKNHFPVGRACQSPQYRQRRLFRYLQRLSYAEPFRADSRQSAASSCSNLRQHHLPRQHY